MERNEELFRRVADAIEANPEQYDQGQWECGTTRCLAGWANRLTGHVVPATWLEIGASASEADSQRFVERMVAFSERARSVLGLTSEETDGPDPDEEGGLFAETWRPHPGLSVPDALRKIGEGAAIEDVSA